MFKGFFRMKYINRIEGKKISKVPVSDNQHDAIPVSYDFVKNNLLLVTQETVTTVNTGSGDYAKERENLHFNLTFDEIVKGSKEMDVKRK